MTEGRVIPFCFLKREKDSPLGVLTSGWGCIFVVGGDDVSSPFPFHTFPFLLFLLLFLLYCCYLQLLLLTGLILTVAVLTVKYNTILYNTIQVGINGVWIGYNIGYG